MRRRCKKLRLDLLPGQKERQLRFKFNLALKTVTLEGAYVQCRALQTKQKRHTSKSKNKKHRQSASSVYVHFRWTMLGPLSSYSSFLIHISSNVLSEDRMDPPIHTEYLRSGGAIILAHIFDFQNRSSAQTKCQSESFVCWPFDISEWLGNEC